VNRCAAFAAVIFLVAAVGCGYRTVGHAVQLPQDLHTVAVPAFINETQTFKIEQLLTQAVVREMDTRTHYHIISHEDPDADATLMGTVLAATSTPLTYDSQTGRVSTVLVTVNVSVSLKDKNGKVLYQNPSYVFRDQYQISQELPSFFEEDSPAVERMSNAFARTLVSNILEAY
jgi:hypothetical protein